MDSIIKNYKQNTNKLWASDSGVAVTNGSTGAISGATAGTDDSEVTSDFGGTGSTGGKVVRLVVVPLGGAVGPLVVRLIP